MHDIIKTVSLTIALGLGLGATAAAPALADKATAPQKASTAAQAPDRKHLLQHLKDHQDFPATRAELLASCKDLIDFTDAEKKWFADRLPEGTYNSPDEVMKAVWKK